MDQHNLEIFGVTPEVEDRLRVLLQFNRTGSFIRGIQTLNNNALLRPRQTLRRLQSFPRRVPLNQLPDPIERDGVSPESIERDTILKKYERIESIPDGGSDTEHCPICLCQFKQDGLLRYLRCSHVFHPSCIDNWLSRRSNCPICRRGISSSS